MQSNNSINKYREAVAFLEGLVNVPSMREYMVDRKDPGIFVKRTKYFLGLLGNPQNRFMFVHITGTAGKGTVATMLANVLEGAGKRVGLFTSPFVMTSTEKIAVNGLYIPAGEFADIVDYLKPFLDKAYTEGRYGRPTYFEIFLAIAFIYFKRQKCEWVVLEVGCGGRYDATNVIKSPAVAAITNIDYDHTHILGDTLNEIARDKAGIIKRGSVFWTSEKRPAILRIFEKECEKVGAKFNVVGGCENYADCNKELVRNIAVGLGIEESAIERGIKKTKLPARFEVMRENPMVVIDGAHNRAKIRSTAANLQKLKFKKLHLIISIADNKDQKAILKEIVPMAYAVYFTRFTSGERRCASPKGLARIAKPFLKRGTRVNVLLDPQMAYRAAKRATSKDDLILITGSFFLANDLRKLWYTEEDVLERRESF